jgi:hypothetical protein
VTHIITPLTDHSSVWCNTWGRCILYGIYLPRPTQMASTDYDTNCARPTTFKQIVCGARIPCTAAVFVRTVGAQLAIDTEIELRLDSSSEWHCTSKYVERMKACHARPALWYSTCRRVQECATNHTSNHADFAVVCMPLAQKSG